MSWSRKLVTAMIGVAAKRVRLLRSSAARSSGAAVFRSMMAMAGSAVPGCSASISSDGALQRAEGEVVLLGKAGAQPLRQLGVLGDEQDVLLLVGPERALLGHSALASLGHRPLILPVQHRQPSLCRQRHHTHPSFARFAASHFVIDVPDCPISVGSTGVLSRPFGSMDRFCW